MRVLIRYAPGQLPQLIHFYPVRYPMKGPPQLRFYPPSKTVHDLLNGVGLERF